MASQVETNLAEGQLVELDPSESLVASFEQDGQRNIIVWLVPRVGAAIPLWRSRDAMVAALRRLAPHVAPELVTMGRFKDWDMLVGIAKTNDLVLISDLTYLGDGQWRYGRIVWN